MYVIYVMYMMLATQRTSNLIEISDEGGFEPPIRFNVCRYEIKQLINVFVIRLYTYFCSQMGYKMIYIYIRLLWYM